MFRYRLLWQLPVGAFVVVLLLAAAHEYAVARGTHRTKDIAYLPAEGSDPGADRHILDVFAPDEQQAGLKPVVVFIHGGSWNSGNKNLYAFLGRRLARQGIVAVIINYRLSPTVEVPAMADDCARAVQWTTQHIAGYGGDPNRIFVMGHSAGGGLAALLATDATLFTRLGMTENPIKGAILDDPAGLDMFDYLTKMAYPGDEQYLIPFGRNPAVWRTVSAMYHLQKTAPPMLLYVGGRTYPGIAHSSQVFEQQLTALGIRHEYYVFPKKKHIPMVTQLFWTSNRIYADIRKLVDNKV